LFFANVDRILNDMRKRILAANPPVGGVIISLEETFDLDSSSIEALLLFFGDMAKSGKRLVLARLKHPVHQMLIQIARTTPAVPQCSGLSVDDAVRLAQAELLVGEKLAGSVGVLALDQVEVAGSHAGFVVRGPGSPPTRRRDGVVTESREGRRLAEHRPGQVGEHHGRSQLDLGPAGVRSPQHDGGGTLVG